MRKHSVTIRGHRTSVSLEDPFWRRLTAIADRREMPVATLVGEIDAARNADENLSSAIRLYILDWVESGRMAGPAS